MNRRFSVTARFWCVLSAIVAIVQMQAQNTVSTYPAITSNGGLATGGITFEVESTHDAVITAFTTALQTTATVVNVWYRIGGVQHAPGNPPNISFGAGWILHEQNIQVNSSSTTIPTQFSLSNPIFVRQNTPVGIFIENSARYRTWVGGSQENFADDTLTIRTGPNEGYGGPAPIPNLPRQFSGSVTYSVIHPCSGAPNAGKTVASANIVCQNSYVALSLQNGDILSGLKYQWQKSTDNITWVDMPNDTFAGIFTQVNATAWYRAMVSCEASSSASTPLQVFQANVFSGVYTLNQNNPTSLVNFQNFEDMQSMIACVGLTGPVVINIVPGSGPYEQQLIIPVINGASATNTLTINGNGETIQYDNINSADRAVVRLDGAKHVILDGLYIKTKNFERGWGIHLLNEADHNIIRHCVIDISSVTDISATASAGIIGTGNNTSNINSGNHTNNTIIEGNRIVGNNIGGAYQGISIYTTGVGNNNITIRNNTIENFHLWGIRLQGLTNVVVEGNIISRPDRNSPGIIRGIHLTGTSGSGIVIRNNKIFDLSKSASHTSAVYGISNGAAGSSVNPILVYNNVIGSFGGGGIHYGLYNSAPWSNYYHNTVVLNDQTQVSNATYGFYTTLATNDNIQVYNNIFYMNRLTSGLQYGIRVNTVTVQNFKSNNNLFYLRSGAGVGFRGSARVSLENWNNATGEDKHSIVMDPKFIDVLGNDLRPTSGLVKSIGMNLTAIVPEDIERNIRPLSPDPGAFQFAPSPCSGSHDFVLDSLNIRDNQGADAIISWESSANSWIVEWGPCGFVPGQGAAFVDSNVTDNRFVISDIPISECWCVYVQEECDTLAQWSNSMQICAYAKFDAELTTLLSPSDGECGLSRTDLQVRITNKGTEPITSLPISASISGDINRYFSATYTGNLGLGQSVDFVVGVFNAYAGGAVQVEVSAKLPNDQNNANDGLSDSVLIISSNPLDFDITHSGHNDLNFTFTSNRANDADSVHWEFIGFRMDTGGVVAFEFPELDTFEVCMMVYSECNPGLFCKLVVLDTTTAVDTNISVVKNMIDEGKVNIYPNPTNGLFTVEFNDVDLHDFCISIMDVRGQLLKSDQVKSHTGKFGMQYDLQNYSAGMYFVRIQHPKGVITKKIMIR